MVQKTVTSSSSVAAILAVISLQFLCKSPPLGPVFRPLTRYKPIYRPPTTKNPHISRSLARRAYPYLRHPPPRAQPIPPGDLVNGSGALLCSEIRWLRRGLQKVASSPARRFLVAAYDKVALHFTQTHLICNAIDRYLSFVRNGRIFRFRRFFFAHPTKRFVSRKMLSYDEDLRVPSMTSLMSSPTFVFLQFSFSFPLWAHRVRQPVMPVLRLSVRISAARRVPLPRGS